MRRREFVGRLFLLGLGAASSLVATDTVRAGPEGVRWNLVSFGYTRMAVPANAWMKLEKGRFQGNAGCNGLGGSYRIEGRKIRFRQGPSTLMACPAMSLETKFRKLLDQVGSFEIKGRELLLKKGGRVLLIFSRAGF